MALISPEVRSRMMRSIEEVQRTIRDLASQIRAFAENEPLAVWFVRWRYDPMKASAGLIGLANSHDTYGKAKAFQRQLLQRRCASNSNLTRTDPAPG